MILRCWLIIGDPSAAEGLPPEMNCGGYSGTVPDASAYQPGQWILFGTGGAAFTLVCAEVPLQSGPH